MMRRLACLAPWMAVAVAWAQGPEAAPPPAVTVDFTYRGSFTDEGVRLDDACYVTPGLMRRWQWTVDVRGDQATIVADGRTIRANVRRIGNVPRVSLDEVAGLLGAKAEWNTERTRIAVRGAVRRLAVTQDGLRLDSTLSVRPRAFRLANPDRLVLDVEGADFAEELIKDLPAGWRIGQYSPNVVRVVVEHPLMARQPVPALEPGRTVEFDLLSVTAGETVAATNLPPGGQVAPGGATSTTAATPQTGAPAEPPPPPAVLSRPRIARESESEAVLVFPYTGELVGGPSAVFLDPTTIQLSVPNTVPARPGEESVTGSNSLGGFALTDAGGATTVLLRLRRPAAFQLTVDGEALTLRLFRPRGANGTLAGKVVVIDPGHGGRDPGATVGGVLEKDVVLAIGRLAAQGLTAAGASVVMTRNDDRFIVLAERSAVANRSNADLFVSVHVNSNRTPNTATGIKVFYHMQDPIGLLLAECMRSEFEKVSGMRCMGNWSDSRIYPEDGFSVLRRSQMPATLLELGFINHDNDRAKMVKPDWQKRIAEAIVRAAQRFFSNGEKPNPQQ